MSDLPSPRGLRVTDWVTAAAALFSTAAILFGVVRWTADRNASEALLRYQLDTVRAEIAAAHAGFEAHLHSLDGRADASDADRRELGNRLTRLETQLDNIRAASAAPLSSRR